MTVIHYSGGIRAQLGRTFTVRLAGWPACCAGDRAVRIAESGRQTDEPDGVTCKRCLALFEASNRPSPGRPKIFREES